MWMMRLGRGALNTPAQKYVGPKPRNTLANMSQAVPEKK
jgi:hypothetical protein